MKDLDIGGIRCHLTFFLWNKNKVPSERTSNLFIGQIPENVEVRSLRVHSSCFMSFLLAILWIKKNKRDEI